MTSNLRSSWMTALANMQAPQCAGIYNVYATCMRVWAKKQWTDSDFDHERHACRDEFEDWKECLQASEGKGDVVWRDTDKPPVFSDVIRPQKERKS